MERFEPHHRRSIRLKGYDYTQVGAYFMTICTQNRECLLGGIVNGQMRANDAGRMIEGIWARLPVRFPFITLDESVIMPNHFHGIVIITDGAGPFRHPDAHGHPGAHTGAPVFAYDKCKGAS